MVAKARLVVEDEKAYKNAKSALPAVTISGVFSQKLDTALVAHSGIIAIDIDRKDNPQGIPLDELAADAFTHAIHYSVSGSGVVVYVLIDGSRHRDAAAALSIYYLKKYGILIDPSCKNESRLRYVSYDPNIHINKKSLQWEEYLPKEKPVKKTFTATTDVETDLVNLAEQCERQRVDVCNCYDNRLRVAFAIANEIGASGFNLFDRFCQIHAEYSPKKTESMFKDAVKTPRKLTAGTVFNIAKQNGWIRERSIDNAPPPQFNRNITQPTAQQQAPPMQNPPPPPMEPFKILGFRRTANGQIFCFYVSAARVVVEIAASKMSAANLFQLAPANYWEMNFPAKNGFKISDAQNWIIQTAYTKGYFDPERLRGRGAWVEGSDIIIHTGQNIIKNGYVYGLNDAKTKYIYEQGPEIFASNVPPLNAAESRKLMELFKHLPFQSPDLDAIFLAGWIALAPVCGLLPWRPHLWITGGAGTGKSWILDKIIRRVLDGVAIEVQGETTEAGIRGRLQNDAIPIVFDEAEPTDRNANQKIQSVLGLMRSASADDGGSIIKGTAGGGSNKYTIRSMFAFASISFAAINESDKSRITKIDLVKTGTKETRRAKFNMVKKSYIETITPQFIQGLQARILGMIPTILQNIEVFRIAAASIVPSQRMADQIGVLFAGCLAITADNVVTLEVAEKLLNKHRFDESAEPETDEQKLLYFIVQHITDVDGNGRNLKRSIGELIEIVTSHTGDDITTAAAEQRLKRIGIRIERESGAWGNVENGDMVMVISNTSIYLRDILSNTAWANNHGEILKRLESANPSPKPVSFGGGIVSRAVSIKIIEQGGDIKF